MEARIPPFPSLRLTLVFVVHCTVYVTPRRVHGVTAGHGRVDSGEGAREEGDTARGLPSSPVSMLVNHRRHCTCLIL